VRRLTHWISPEPLAAKVPEIGFMFWIVRLLTTAGGEAGSNYLGHNVVIGAVVELILVTAALLVQLRTRRYIAAAYWLLALAIAVFGTGISDTVHTVLGISYEGMTLIWGAILAETLWRWHQREGTRSIHSITTRRREGYYWATVFATFALSTALGDYIATALNLGFLASGILFAVIIAILALAWWKFRLNAVTAFWFTYVVTRPLGASFADYVSKPRSLSGIGFGDGPTSTVLIAAVIAGVTYLAITRRDIQSPASAPAHRQPARALIPTDPIPGGTAPWP
jgi:uncharacterized membrane-anchored protein